MPSQNKVPTKQLAILGDSHLASAKQAVDKGEVNLEGWHTRFWGAQGRYFKTLKIEDGLIFATTEPAKAHIREVFGSDDPVDLTKLDAILLLGFRLKPQSFFHDMLQQEFGEGRFYSQIVLRELARDWLQSQRNFKLAQKISQTVDVPVLLSLTSFRTDGIAKLPSVYADVHKADKSARDRLWDALIYISQLDNIKILPQDDSTIVKGCLTDTRYSAGEGTAIADSMHKNSAFSAIVLNQVIERLNDVS